ncbi:hypothetical protein BC332_31747 [Capsicum chinense]|nr:hypothetical protein BC332_31747 [Capsicum chinense]
MGKSFDASRKILREQKLDSYFRKSCFGKYLDLSEDNNARFQMKMVYDLLKHPKVIDGIKMKLFGATAITRKIILESGANDAPLTVFKTTSHYDYDHNSCTDFSPDFTAYSECSSCKCQDCKAKHDGFINAINALTTFVKEMTSKKGVIPSKRISYPDTPLEIKCARATEEQHELKKVDVTATTEEHNKTVDNPSTASKDKKNVESAVIILKERHIRVYNSMSRRRYFGPSSEIQKLAKILPTYLDMSGFLDQKICTDWSTIEAYRDKMANPFDVQYVDEIAQQTIGSLDCGPFVAAYTKYLSDGL